MFVNELRVMLINGNESVDFRSEICKIQVMNHLLVNLSAFPSWIDVNYQSAV